MSRICSCAVALFVLAIAAVMSGCSSSSPPISVSVSSSRPAIDQGQTVGFTATVASDMSSKGVVWTLTGPGSLSGSSAVFVTYTPPTTSLSSAQQVTVTAKSAADQTKSASRQITVNPYLQIPFQTLVGGSVGTAYSQTIALTGGTPPFQWSVYNGPIITGYKLGGAIPDGLKLDGNRGIISGAPTGGGTWYFDATITDATGATADNGFLSIQINSTSAPGNPLPFLNQPLVPTAVSPGAAGFTLSVSGTGFTFGSTIEFNHAPLTTTFVDSEHLTAMVPAAKVASAATAAVTVVNPAPGGGPSNAANFQVAAPEATINFVNAANSPLQVNGPLGIVAADFDEDGKLDLAVSANTVLNVLLGRGNGTFAPTTNSPMRVPSPPYDDFGSPYVGPLAVGDFNHSGHQGLALGEIQNEAAVILLGSGDGNLVPSPASFANAFGQPTTAINAVDFNADGNLDLVIANEFSGQSPVLLGYGNGAFNAAGTLPGGTLQAGTFPMGTAIGDFNADGKLDVIVASGGTSTYPGSGMTVALGRGNGTFTLASGSPIPVANNLSAIVAADFNGDGKLDVAVTDFDGNTVLILLGNGDGTFGPPTTIPVGSQPDAVVAGDFNNDGKMDLAVANYGDGTVTLLLGNGSGAFSEASVSPYAVGGGPFQLVAADFNGDGKLDLAVGNVTDGTVSVLLQQ